MTGIFVIIWYYDREAQGQICVRKLSKLLYFLMIFHGENGYAHSLKQFSQTSCSTARRKLSSFRSIKHAKFILKNKRFSDDTNLFMMSVIHKTTSNYSSPFSSYLGALC